MSTRGRYAEKLVNPDFYGMLKIAEMKKTLTVMTVKPREAEAYVPGYMYAPYVPMQATTKIGPEDFHVRGRFPWLARVSDPFVPPPGTLVFAKTGRKQFGIVGKRGEVVGVFWSSDGWVSDYREGELGAMFAHGAVEEVS